MTANNNIWHFPGLRNLTFTEFAKSEMEFCPQATKLTWESLFQSHQVFPPLVAEQSLHSIQQCCLLIPSYKHPKTQDCYFGSTVVSRSLQPGKMNVKRPSKANIWHLSKDNLLERSKKEKGAHSTLTRRVLTTGNSNAKRAPFSICICNLRKEMRYDFHTWK